LIRLAPRPGDISAGRIITYEMLAPEDTIRDSPTAIAIGREECGAEDWERRVPKGVWGANLSGAHWDVWFAEPGERIALLSVRVAKNDGKTTDCVLIVP
jgi:hypothetical protein